MLLTKAKELLLLALLILHFPSASSIPSWPCIQLGPGLNICQDGTTPCKTNPDPTAPPARKFVCDPPICTGSDAPCAPFKCLGTICDKWTEKAPEDTCTTHVECGPGNLCNSKRVCEAIPLSSPFASSTLAQCKVGLPSCDPGEVCRPDPDTSTGNGVCLEDSKDPTAINQLDAILTGKSSGGTGIPEGQSCTIGSSKCVTPFFCDKDGICKRTKNLRSEVTGHRIPPPPGDPNCRDALDSGETNEANTKCKDRKSLCSDPLYVGIMKEQCPKTCGYCDDPTLELDLASASAERKASRDQDRSGNLGDTVKVDPSASCSDRKRPGMESDCPKLKNLCNDATYKTLMEEQCAKTCGFCT